MSKLRQVSGKEISRVLLRLGFEFKSQTGSHMKFVKRHPFGKEVVIVPNHKTLKQGTLANILGKLNLGTEEFIKLL